MIAIVLWIAKTNAQKEKIQKKRTLKKNKYQEPMRRLYPFCADTSKKR